MINVGISQCLMGAPVRYDGGHRFNRFCSIELSKLFKFVSLCPEVGIGLTTPRKTIRLVNRNDRIAAVESSDTRNDYTEKLEKYADNQHQKLKELSGYILCKASPSCGMERVKVYRSNGQAEKKGMGIYAARLKKNYPLLPMEEDGRLNDPLLRDSFIKRVYLYHEWNKLSRKNQITPSQLVSFHSKHKMTLLAHCPKIYRKLGPLVASARVNNIDKIAQQYIHEFLQAMKKTATRSNNTNVLMHLQGYLKKVLSKTNKAELRQCIIDYNRGLLPILAPITLLKHHFANNPNSYINQLSYFEPYPKQLAIRVATQ